MLNQSIIPFPFLTDSTLFYQNILPFTLKKKKKNTHLNIMQLAYVLQPFSSITLVPLDPTQKIDKEAITQYHIILINFEQMKYMTSKV